MTSRMLSFLRCPVTGSKFRLQIISTGVKKLDGTEQPIILTAILFADHDWLYPVIDGIPRLLIESFLEHDSFLLKHVPDYLSRKKKLQFAYPELIAHAEKKNRITKRSFEQEWDLYDYTAGKTWGANRDEMLDRFLTESGESVTTLKDKLIFDAGCGNGLLNQLIARHGATIVGMDFSRSIERAFRENEMGNAFFIQGDVQFPPVAEREFDIVHCSGVLIHTDDTQKSFNCLEPCVKPGGKLSVWLYHPQKSRIHHFLLWLRKYTSRLPVRVQYHLYKFTLLPVTFVIKRVKGNKQSARDMMIELLDHFTPEFRWEHEHDEVLGWFSKKGYSPVTITTENQYGFNITGVKNTP